MPTRSETSPKSQNQKTAPHAAPSTLTATDAIVLLEQDHRTVEGLFQQFESAKSDQQKKQIVRQLCDELTVHALLEETSFYPQARAALGEETDLVDEAKVEHGTLKWLIAQLEDEAPGADLYDAKVKVLQEYVKHHVEEEEKEMFPKLRGTQLDLDQLGETLQAVKQELQKSLITH
jgi:hemerythrin superfamily protein